MPSFTSTSNNPNDPAILASSAGEGLHAESSSVAVAAVAAIQLNTAPTSKGPALFGEARGGGSAVVGLQVNSLADGPAVYAECRGTGAAIVGVQNNPAAGGAGVYAECKGTGSAISAFVKNPAGEGAALYAEHIGDKTAGFFKGNVIVTGDVSFPGMDCAEEFAVASNQAIEAGTLMAIGTDGVLEPSASAYDRKVVGVVAGAGDFRPAIVMGKGQHEAQSCRPIALVGRAYCKADAAFGPIDVGDLLTSSPRPGHAMKACDQSRAFGAVIGKAMAPLDQGAGLIPILIALQ